MIGLHAMSISPAFRGAPAAWLFALALALACAAPVLGADSVPTPAAADPAPERTALTPGPPSSRFT
jgi:hypothetical protein